MNLGPRLIRFDVGSDTLAAIHSVVAVANRFLDLRKDATPAQLQEILDKVNAERSKVVAATPPPSV